MVSSYTALRTMLRQKYNAKAVKTTDGLFVEGLLKGGISEIDQLQYDISYHPNGSIWAIKGLPIPEARPKGRQLDFAFPYTRNNFFARLSQEKDVKVIGLDIARNTRIVDLVTDTASLHNYNLREAIDTLKRSLYIVDLMFATPRWAEYDIEQALSKHVYLVSAKDTHKVRVYLEGRKVTQLKLRDDVMDSLLHMLRLCLIQNSEQWNAEYGFSVSSWDEMLMMEEEEFKGVIKTAIMGGLAC